MKKIFLRMIAPLFVAFCISCGFGGKSEIVKDDGTIQMGDLVLAPFIIDGKPGFNPMGEAVVGRIDGGKATVFFLNHIKYGNDFAFSSVSNTSKVEFDIKDLIKVPSTAEPTASFKPGDKVYVLSSATERMDWYAAEIVRVDKDKDLMEAVYISGDKKSVSLVSASAPVNNMSALIRITGEFLAKVENKAKGQDLLKDAQSHRLVMVENYKPQIGDEVLAQPTTITIVQGKIISAETDEKETETRKAQKLTGTPRIGITFGNAQSEKGVWNYVPLSALQNPPPVSVGQFVIVRPDSAVNWDYAIITAINGDTLEVNVGDVGGVTPRTVRKGDYYPLK